MSDPGCGRLSSRIHPPVHSEAFGRIRVKFAGGGQCRFGTAEIKAVLAVGVANDERLLLSLGVTAYFVGGGKRDVVNTWLVYLQSGMTAFGTVDREAALSQPLPRGQSGCGR